MVTVETAKKHFRVLPELGAFLQERNRAANGTLIPRFDSNIFKTALQRLLVVNSTYVKNIVNGAISYAEKAQKATEDNLPVSEYLTNLDVQPENVLLPTFTNAVTLRDVIISLAVCDTARRSVELTAFELQEFRNPKAIQADFALFKVANHKTWKTKASYIRLQRPVFLALCSFVSHYRSYISQIADPVPSISGGNNF